MKKHLFTLDATNEILNNVTSKEFLVGVKNEAEEDEIELSVYGRIGKDFFDDSATSASDVAKLLRDNRGKKVNVKINSPGGLAYDGITIYNALLEHDALVTTTVMGMAGSAAAIISQAGSTRKIYANASFFIHRALGMAWGNIDVMNDVADFLNKLDDQIAETFAARSGQRKAAVLKAMKGNLDGTTYTADAAKKEGYFDEVLSVVPKDVGKKKAKNEGPDSVKEELDKQAEAESTARYQGMINARLRSIELDGHRFGNV